jgi:hypothetical protein
LALAVLALHQLNHLLAQKVLILYFLLLPPRVEVLQRVKVLAVTLVMVVLVAEELPLV